MLAEGTRREDQLKAFDLDYGWGAAFKEWNKAAAVRKLWETMRRERPRGGARFARFFDNHDIANDDYENRVEKRWGPARVNATLVALFTLDGVPFLYNGQEVADTARHSIFGRLPIQWENGEAAAGRARFALCQRLCAMRKARKALTQGELAWLDNDQPEAILSFVRTLGNEQVLTTINLTDKPVKASVKGAGDAFKPLLAEGVKGDMRDGAVFEGHGYAVSGK